MNPRTLRIGVLVAVVAMLAFFAYDRYRPNAHGSAVIGTNDRLKCVVPGTFTMAMGHAQSLHDRAGTAVVQLASIAPNAALANWTSAKDFDAGDHGQLVAFICATESYKKLSLAGGSAGNELWLRHTGAGDTPADWTAFMHPVGSTSFESLTVFRRDTNPDATLHPPGHAQWVDGDENIWVSCGHGCCYVTGGGGGDTTHTK